MPIQTTQTMRPAQTLAPAAPSPAAAAKRRSAMASLAARLDVEPNALMRTLQNTVFRGATNEEFASLCIVANVYGLNPLTKEIYAFPAKKGGIVPLVSIDGWCKIVNARPEFDGCEFEAGEHPAFGPYIRCRMFRKDRGHPIEATEFLHECDVDTSPVWKKSPMRMLRHRAFIQAARMAFGFGGIYAPEGDDPAEVLPAEAAAATPLAPREAAQDEPEVVDAAVVPPQGETAAAPAAGEPF